MKIYVDGEMPKSCFDCIVCQKDDLGYWCGDENCYISDENVGNRRLSECPLQSLAEHDKKVRKQVVEEIEDRLNEFAYLMFNLECPDGVKYGVFVKDIIDILDQVERSEKDGRN